MNRRGSSASAFALAALLFSPDIRADDPPKKLNVVSYEPFAITSRGLLVQYERLVLPRFSVIGGAGGRLGAREDFQSTTWTVHGEARFWTAGKDYVSGFRGLAGPHAAFSVNLGRTTVHDRREDRRVGAEWTLVETLSLGYRFVIADIQEITPSFGLALVHTFDAEGRLAPSTRLSFLSLGLTVGWVF
jgi:hypothetical protein